MMICKSCGWDIDEETCWCGEGTQGHDMGNGHSFVPMGCTCGYADAENRRNPDLILKEASHESL